MPKPTFTPSDIAFMRRALSLARRGQGRVEPNPLVGAVLVKNNKIIAEGYHHYYGGPHAEIDALTKAGNRARGATLYVTLEPCCHFGKTPPCTDALIAGGVTKVFAALRDPFPKVAGKGARQLRAANIPLTFGLLESEARTLLAPFLLRLSKTPRPFIIAKWAQSLDGALATAAGDSKWISSPHSRAAVHRLRARVDAILVGIGTALADDPLLTPRLPPPARPARIPTRIILDSACRLPLTSRLLATVSEAPLLIAHARNLRPAAEKRRAALAARGAMTLPLPSKNHRLDLTALLTHLAANDYTNLLLEGGPTLLASFLAQNLIDESHIFLAPLLIPGTNAHRPFPTPNIPKIGHAPHLQITFLTPSGPDYHLIAHPTKK